MTLGHALTKNVDSTGIELQIHDGRSENVIDRRGNF